jgi:MFS family permease
MALGFIQDSAMLPLFIIILLLTLIAMSTFRSPAVALMPDVTIRPLRSKGNAIINLMGTAGGIIILVFGIIFKTGTPGKTNFLSYIIAVCGVMLTGLIIFLFTVKENKWVQEMEEESRRLGLDDNAGRNDVGNKELSKEERKSLLLILASVALWYIGYNAVTSKYSVYATNVLGFDYNLTLIVAQAAAVVTYIPVGIIASKIGRRKSILSGVVMLTTAFILGCFLSEIGIEALAYPVFALAGIGWATINVNSFPMVVELAKGGNVGKYTGYYYTASMSAQIVTPILSGILVERVFGWGIFFPYAAFFAAASFVTMFFVKHGDSKAEKQGVLEALGGADD